MYHRHIGEQNAATNMSKPHDHICPYVSMRSGFLCQQLRSLFLIEPLKEKIFFENSGYSMPVQTCKKKLCPRLGVTTYYYGIRG